jgi:two-component system LytT family response regulator
MKIVIVEDEQASQAYLQSMLQKHFPDMEIAAITDSVPESVAQIKKHHPQVVFIDVEIKMGNGFDVLEQVKGQSFEVIFTTAFNTFAVEAFRYHAIDYLLKPLDEMHFVEAVGRCVQRLGNQNHGDQIGKLLEQLQPTMQKVKLSVPTLDGIEFIPFSDIVYCEAQGNYTDFRLKTGLKITASRKLKDMEESLPQHLFFRIHHSYVVNLQYVKKYQRGRGGYVVLQDGTSIPVSSARKDEFLEWLG